MANRIISIIIVNYRSAAFTKACLRSIYDNHDAQAVEVIVVDNASYDGCGEMMKSAFPEAAFIQSSENVGFAGANNIGITVARGSYFLFLNPDTEIQGNAIERLLESLASIPEAGMVGARLLNSDLSIQTTSITAFPSIVNQVLGTEYLRQRFPRAKLWGMKPLFEKASTPIAVDAISGACMMAKREVIEQVNGFTRDYFMYAEDLDLCLKVKKAGWRVYYVSDSIIVHHGGRSSDSRPESNYAAIMIRESMCRFMELHRGRWYAWLFRAALTGSAAGRLLLLTFMLPVLILGARKQAVIRAWKKWASLLAWGVGVETWVQGQHPTPQAFAPPAGTPVIRAITK